MTYQTHTALILFQKDKNLRITTLTGSYICSGMHLKTVYQQQMMSGDFNTFQLSPFPMHIKFATQVHKIYAFIDLQNNILYLDPSYTMSDRWNFFIAAFLLFGVGLIFFILVLIFTFDASEAYDLSSTMVLSLSPIIFLYGINGYYLYLKTVAILKALDFSDQQIKKIEDFIPSTPGIYPLNKIYDFY